MNEIERNTVLKQSRVHPLQIFRGVDGFSIQFSGVGTIRSIESDCALGIEHSKVCQRSLIAEVCLVRSQPLEEYMASLLPASIFRLATESMKPRNHAACGSLSHP